MFGNFFKPRQKPDVTEAQESTREAQRLAARKRDEVDAAIEREFKRMMEARSAQPE